MRITWLLLLFHCSSFCFAQDITFESIFPNGDINIIYRGRDNLFIIKGLPPKVSFKLTHGNFVKINSNTYDVKIGACYAGAGDTLEIYSGLVLIMTKYFIVKDSPLPPRPRLLLGNEPCRYTNWTIAELMAEPTLKIIPETSRCTIDSFNISLVPRIGQSIGPYTIKGCKLHGPKWNAIKNRLTPGINILIEAPYISNCSGKSDSTFSKRISLEIEK